MSDRESTPRFIARLMWDTWTNPRLYVFLAVVLVSVFGVYYAAMSFVDDPFARFAVGVVLGMTISELTGNPFET